MSILFKISLMQVLVTGANGFLGSHLVRALELLGHSVISFVRPTGNLELLKNTNSHIVLGDIADIQAIMPSVAQSEAVFHLAGMRVLKPGDLPEAEKVNVLGTANIAQACLKAGRPKLIFVSSVASIGSTTDGKILNESSPPTSSVERRSNSSLKYQAELILQKHVAENGLNAVIVNPGMIFGAGDARIPVRSGFVRTAQGKMSLYPKGGVNVVGVQDVVNGILSAWERGRTGERYILGGENWTHERIYKTVAAIAKSRALQLPLPTSLLKGLATISDKLKFNSVLNSENIGTATEFLWFDHLKASRELDYSPKPTYQAIEQSVSWMIEKTLI